MIIIGLDYGIRHIAVAYINTNIKHIPTLDVIYKNLIDNNDVDNAFNTIKILINNFPNKVLIVYESIDAYFNPNASKMSGQTIQLYALLNDYCKNKKKFVVLKIPSSVTKQWAKTAFFANFRKKIKQYTKRDKLPNNHATDAINMALYGQQQVLLRYVTYVSDEVK